MMYRERKKACLRLNDKCSSKLITMCTFFITPLTTKKANIMLKCSQSCFSTYSNQFCVLFANPVLFLLARLYSSFVKKRTNVQHVRYDEYYSTIKDNGSLSKGAESS